MSGQLIGGVIGAAAGFFIPGVGPMLGFAIGSAIGGAVAPGELPTQYGPRMEDLRPQSSEYGRPIPIVYGTVGMAGNVIWASDYVEVPKESEQGGKGGSPSQTTVQYEYFGNFAVMFCEGPNTIGRMWAGPGKRLIWDGAALEGGGTVRIYTGSESQMPDPLIESYLGAGNVPAYRGVCYAVFENFPLAKDGNALPFITAEIGATAGMHGQPPVMVYDQTIPNDLASPTYAQVDPATGWVWIVEETLLQNEYRVQVINDVKQELIAEWTLVSPFGPVNTEGLSMKAGLVWILSVPFRSTMRRAAVANFTSGEANTDGSVKVMPAFMGHMRFGEDGKPVGPENEAEKPRDPHAIFATDTDVWVSYAFSNAVPTQLAYFPIQQMTFGSPLGEPVTQANYGELSTGHIIGNPHHMAGDNEIIGVAGSLGPSEGSNFLVIDAPTLTVLHAVRWEINDVTGKTFDYDPVRKVFISHLGGNPGSITTLNAISGEIVTSVMSYTPGDAEPAPAPFPQAVTYSKRSDRYLIGSSTSPDNLTSGSTVFVINPDTLETEFAATFEAGGQIVMPLLDPATTTGAPYVLSFDGDSLKRLYIGGETQPTPANLGEIVMNLHQRAGLPADAADVSELTDMVPGYAIARQTTVRGAIDALRPAYYFDGVESGGRVKFPKRGKQSVAVIDDNDLAAHQADGEPGDPLLTTRQMEVELPKRVVVNYLSAATDYEKAAQPYNRQIGSSEEEVTLDLPLVLTDTKAQEIAQVSAHVPWVQRLRYGPFNLPRKYSHLEPTDVITVKGYDMILEKVTATPGGILTCEAVATDSSHYFPHVVVTETVPNEKIVYTPGETTLELM